MNQPSPVGAKALIANPALQPLAFLIGRWRTTGTHPLVPGEALRGVTTFAWHEGGAFIVMRTEVHAPKFPDVLAIIGSDDTAGRFAMTYFDERGTSRLFTVTAGDRTVTWLRDDPHFAQTTTLTAEGPDKLVGTGRMSLDGGAWAADLSQVFERGD
ncbi:MAG: hypothetical protein ABIT16_04455 [Croceibacterium sp.]